MPVRRRRPWTAWMRPPPIICFTGMISVWLAEPIPAGVLTHQASIQKPPAPVPPAEILPETLPDAWEKEESTAFSINTVLSQKYGQTLPWKTVRDAVSASINARFTRLDTTSGQWPCEYPLAQEVKLKCCTVSDINGGQPGDGDGASIGVGSGKSRPHVLVARSELKADQIQDIGDIVPKLLEIKNKSNIPLTFKLQIELGDGQTQPDDETVRAMNALLRGIRDDFQLK